jgi:hypothetical protein
MIAFSEFDTRKLLRISFQVAICERMQLMVAYDSVDLCNLGAVQGQGERQLYDRSQDGADDTPLKREELYAEQ